MTYVRANAEDAKKVKESYLNVSASAYFERIFEAAVTVDHAGLILGTTNHVKKLDVKEPTTGIETSTVEYP